MAGVCFRVGVSGFCVYDTVNQTETAENENTGITSVGVFVKFSPTAVALNESLNNSSQYKVKTSVLVGALSQTTTDDTDSNTTQTQTSENTETVKKSVILTPEAGKYKGTTGASDSTTQTAQRVSILLNIRV